jgi:3-dehydroquinate dehydratase-2
MHRVLVINGPNLNLLGEREQNHYGPGTLADLEHNLQAAAKTLKIGLLTYQSNAEHEILERIHAAKGEGVGFIVINPGAFTHTSIALRDALLGVAIPFIEVHLSNVHAREPFRQHSYLSDIAAGVISGLGAQGYEFALQAAKRHLDDQQ